jgi:dolichol-phosphate mannosyltransferase
MDTEGIKMSTQEKQVPAYDVILSNTRHHPYMLVIPVINEGQRIHSLIKKMQMLDVMQKLDICVVDGGSTDGSLDETFLQSKGVHSFLLKKGPGRLSAQLRCAYDYVLKQGYSGVITIDGNDKDDPASIPLFIKALEDGVDFVQASRFIPGGKMENTPWLRLFAIRWIHAPLLSLCSGFSWTDTTQGYRAYSCRLLSDKKVSIFRDVFAKYELLSYLSYRAPRLGYKCLEVPTSRIYPPGEVPTKISSFGGNWDVFKTLVKTCLGFYNP